MPQGPYAALNAVVVVSGTGVTSPILVTHAKGLMFSCGSTAGHLVTVEGSLDKDSWSAFRVKYSSSAATLALTGADGAGLLASNDIAVWARFNVVSLTAATTLTLGAYGLPIAP